MNTRDRFFDELQRAIARGFTLAAVSVSLSCTKPAPAASESVSAAPPPKPRLKALDGGLLAQVPAGSLGCSGAANPPFHGRCCTNVHCYAPPAETCAEASELNSRFAARVTPRLPLGSGTCACGQTEGPFAQPDGGVTECCYVVGTMGCSGRPLREGALAVVAEVVFRGEWA